MSSTNIIRYAPSNYLKILLFSGISCGFLGLSLVLLDIFNLGRLKQQNAASGGLFLLLLATFGLVIAYQRNIELEIHTTGIRIVQKLLWLEKSIEFEYREITNINWNFFSGTINIILRNNRTIRIPADIYRVEGELQDHAEKPEIPAGGPTREMFNLKAELAKRVELANP